jgi:hypothetical protein
VPRVGHRLAFWASATFVVACVASLAAVLGARGAPGGPVISTVAGNGTRGFSGDNGPAISAAFKELAGVAATADGGYLVADEVNNRIRRVSPAPSSTVTTVAGNGAACSAPTASCGDGGNAKLAQLNAPSAVAELPDGSILIADTGDQKIRKVSPGLNATITTVAGIGTSCLNSLSPCGDGGPATSAQLSDPSGVAAKPDGGFLIADYRDHRIREVSPSNGTITTVAGDGHQGFTPTRLNFPAGVAVTADGGFLIADSFNHAIRKVSPPPSSTMTTVAGDGTQCTALSNSSAQHPCGDGGPATSAQLNGPTSVAETPDGDILIADYFDQRIRKVVGTTISTVAGTGVSTSTLTGDGGPAVDAQLSGPRGVAATADGGFLIADRFHFSVRRVTAPAPVDIVVQLPGFCRSDGRAARLGLAYGPGPGTVTATSSNTSVVPPNAITFTPSHAAFVATASGARTGTAVLTFTFSNGQRSATARVTLKIAPYRPRLPARLAGTPGIDILLGTPGTDFLGGFGGLDLLCGGAGNDVLSGGAGPDILDGGAGNDTLTGGPGADQFRGGPGVDRALDFKPAEGDTRDGTIP